MEKFIDKRSMPTLQGRIMKIIVLIALLVLGISIGLATLYEVRSIMQAQISVNKTAARLTAEHCVTVLSFGYPEKAEEILNDLVRLQGINVGYIFDEQGKIFAASHNASLDIKIPDQNMKGHLFTGDTLDVWEEVQHKGKYYGLVLLRKETGLTKKLQTLFITSFSLLSVLLIMAYLLAIRLTNRITRSIREIVDVAEKASGDNLYPVEIEGAFQIKELSVLSSSLRRMFSSLRKNQEEDARQNWLKSGEAELAEYLRRDLGLVALGDKVLSFIARYVDAYAGALFFRKANDFILTAGYAFRLRKANDNVFGLGEGMVGQAALEKKVIIFNDVPGDHLNLLIDSGIAETTPVSIVVMPLIYDNEVQGVMELATTTSFGEQKIKFLELAAEAVATSLYAANSRSVTESLLSETQRQSIELQTRQEELKAANEELEEQAIELRRSQKLLQEQREELEAANEELVEKTLKMAKERTVLSSEVERLNKERESQTSTFSKQFDFPVTSTDGAFRNELLFAKNIGDDAASKMEIVDDRYSLNEGEKSALIIEDDPVFAKVLKKVAVKKGYKVLLAECGRDGLLMAEKYHPQAIILDLGLPDMDGMKVLNCLKHDAATKDIPVHIASAHDHDMTTLQRGAIGYLSKPASTSELKRVFELFDHLTTGVTPHLLIVEKNEESLNETLQLFSGRKVHITTSINGTEAIKLLSTNSFEAMILNIDLPDIDGVTLLDHLYNKENMELPPVVVYTGRNLTKEEMASFEQKVSSVVVKGPDSQERLLDEISLFFHAVNAELPRYQQQKTVMHRSTESVLEGKKVLVVDDDSKNIFALSKLLEREGLKVISAEDGRQALIRLTENPNTDLVLMDIMMPDMDGFEATRRIRNMKEFKKLPVLALTAKAMKGDREKCLESGANDYLAKPVDKEKLISMIRVWIGR